MIRIVDLQFDLQDIEGEGEIPFVYPRELVHGKLRRYIRNASHCPPDMIITEQLLFTIPLVGWVFCAGTVSSELGFGSLAVPMGDNALECYVAAVMKMFKKPDRLVAP